MGEQMITNILILVNIAILVCRVRRLEKMLVKMKMEGR